MSETPTPTFATRTVEGLELPEAGTFVIDPAHSHVGFVVRHMMIAKVRGRFSDFTATVTVGEDHLESALEVTVNVAGIDTGDEGRDTHLSSPDFFDVEKYPTMTYRSTSITPLGGDKFRVEGDLTVRDITRPVVLDATFDGVVPDPWGHQRIGFAATAEIDREDFGLTWNQTMETGGVLIGKQVKLEIEAEFVRQ
jgi:polyisoprenoid-binding protein YceI